MAEDLCAASNAVLLAILVTVHAKLQLAERVVTVNCDTANVIHSAKSGWS